MTILTVGGTNTQTGMFSTSETRPLRNNAERDLNMLGVAGNFLKFDCISAQDAFLLQLPLWLEKEEDRQSTHKVKPIHSH